MNPVSRSGSDRTRPPAHARPARPRTDTKRATQQSKRRRKEKSSSIVSCRARPWLCCRCRCLRPASSSPFPLSSRHASLRSALLHSLLTSASSLTPRASSPLLSSVLASLVCGASAPRASYIYIQQSRLLLPTSNSGGDDGDEDGRSHERLLHVPGARAGRTRPRRRADVAAGAAPCRRAAQGPALAAHAHGGPAPPAAWRPVARRVHGRDRAPLGRLPRRQARRRRRRALLCGGIMRRCRSGGLAPGPLPCLYSPGDEGDLGVAKGGDGRGGGEPRAGGLEDRAAVAAARREAAAARHGREAHRLQRLPGAPLRAAQRELPPPAHPRPRRRLLVRGGRRGRLRGRRRMRLHGVHRDAAAADGGGGGRRPRGRAGRDQDVRVPVRARRAGGRARGGGARRRGGAQVRGRRRQGQGGGAQGVAGRATHRHRGTRVPARRLPRRHCRGQEGALRSVQPLITPRSDREAAAPSSRSRHKDHPSSITNSHERMKGRMMLAPCLLACMVVQVK